MAKKSGGINYDINRFRVHPRYGWLEYQSDNGKWQQAEYEQEEWWEKNQNKKAKENSKITKTKKTSTPRPRSSVSKSYYKYFDKSVRESNFKNSRGHVQKWAKPLVAKGGKNPNYNWQRVHTRDYKGNTKLISSKEKWGTQVDAKGHILYGTEAWIQQILIANYQLSIQIENFRVMVLQRALKIFKDSIKYQKFMSGDSAPYPALRPFTLRKRAVMGTGTHILRESGIEALVKSLVIEGNAVVTKPVTVKTRFPLTKDGKLNPAYKDSPTKSVVYAGYHNEGEGHHGKISTPYKQRQFMGHSTYLDPLSDNFMSTMLKRYLFDSIFMVKKV